MHNPCLDSGSGGKPPIEYIIGTNGKFSNMHSIILLFLSVIIVSWLFRRKTLLLGDR